MFFGRIRSRRLAAVSRDEKTLRGRRARRLLIESIEQLEVRLAPATLVVNSFADNTTDTSHLTLRDAITLIDNSGNPTSLGQMKMPAGWVSQINEMPQGISQPFGDQDTINFDSALSGDTIILNGNALTISSSLTITGPGAGNLTISGNNASLIFQINQGTTVALSGLTLEDGSGNIVDTGGTASVNGTSIPVTYTAGGAINNQGTLTLTQLTLTNNVAAGLYSYGGAIDNAGNVTLNSSTLSDNQSTDAANWGGGGAIYNTSAGTVNLVGSTLLDNAVTTIAQVTGLGTSSAVGGGGAVDNLGTLTATNSTLANNTAPVGGAIDNSGTLTAIDSTLADNVAETGGGIDNVVPGQASLENTIVATNTAGTAPDVSGTVSGNNNLIGIGAGLTGIANGDGNDNLVGTTAIPLNPLLTPPGNYGGVVQTIALLASSPAIGAGSTSSSAMPDERGAPRPTTTAQDIGAYQTQAPVQLTVSAPATVIAGVAFPVTITAVDQNSDPVTTDNGSVNLTSSDQQTVFLSDSSISLFNGVATVMVTLAAADSTTLVAASGSLSGTSAAMVVSPSITSLAISAPSTATAGASFQVTITADNQAGNTAVGYNGPVTLTSSDGQPLVGVPASIMLSQGTATVTVTLDKADTITLAASASAIQGTSASIAVSPASVATFTVVAPGTAGAGEAFAVTLTAYDPFQNVVTSYNGAVTLTSSGNPSVPLTTPPLQWTNGVATASVTIANSGATPITLTATAGNATGTSNGFVVESTASEAISSGLAALANWAAGQAFPLVGTTTSIQTELQLGLINPIDTYLAGAAYATSSQSFLSELNSLSTQIGNLEVTATASYAASPASGYTINFQATDTAIIPLTNLGSQAQDLGISLSSTTDFSVTTSLTFQFTFGVNQSSGPVFFVSVLKGGLSASVAIDATAVDSAIAIGFLGAQSTNGSVDLSATIANTAAESNLTVAGIQGLSLQSNTLSLSGSLTAVFPLEAQLGGQSASGTLTISAPNLASSTTPALTYQGFSGWENFSSVSPNSVLSLLDQLPSQLGQLGQDLWTTDLPFLTSLSLAQAANLEQAFQTEVTNQIGYWSDTLQEDVADFSTAQGLASVLAQVLDVSPSSILVQFNPTTNVLTYNLPFTSYTFSSLLNQAIQVSQNFGPLTNASVSASQLSLIPELQANLTIGINLTPLGQGYVVTPTTQLSTLNDGAGVRINGTTPDLQITLSTGATYEVSLNGAQTVQNVINDIESQTDGAVSVAIDQSNQQALDLSQVLPAVVAGAPSVFGVAAINGSYAAADLGIAGSDVEGIGMITGQSLSGDSLQKHFLIESATFDASVAGAVSGVSATADLGAVALRMTGGSGSSIQAQGKLSLTNPTTFAQITQAIQGTTPLSALATAQVCGSASLQLNLSLAVPIAGYSLPSGAAVNVNWPKITDPTTLTVTVTPAEALNLENLTIAPVLTGLEDVEGFVQSAGASLLAQQLPGLDVGTSLLQLLNPAALLNIAVGDLSVDTPLTIDQLVTQLSTLLGQNVTLSFTNDMLEINLNYSVSTSQDANLDLNLSSALSIADASASAPVNLSVTGSIALGLDIDLRQPTAPKFYVQGGNLISVTALVEATNLAFNANIGPLGIAVSGGTVRLDDGTVNAPATWVASLSSSSPNDQLPLASASGDISTAITGQVDIDLPIFNATTGQPIVAPTSADPNPREDIQLIVPSITSSPSTWTLNYPDFSTALSGISLSGIMNQAVNGWDDLMQTLESILDGEINTENIPIVGPQLEQALNFLQTMDQTVTQQLENTPELDGTIIQTAIYDALGPSGLNWLVDLTPGGADAIENYVQLTETSTGDHFFIQLEQGLVAISAPIAANLGLSGLGLSINGNASLSAGFSASLGFGLSTTSGFYIDSTDTASIGFTAELPSSATATLGFLQFNLSNNAPSTPQLSGGLTLALNNLNGTGQLSLDDLSTSSAYTLGFNAGANINLHLDATLAGNANLPHVSTDFYFTWSTAPTNANPDTLGFSNVTIDLGGFIDSIENEIGEVLGPIKPLAEVLTAPLPVLSQLAGHNIDLVDLASALGFCSSSTADFINEVAEFAAGGGFGLPESLDVGGFTLNVADAQNPAAQGNMNPASTTTDQTYGGSPVEGFQIPILSDPMDAFKLLLGKSVPIVTYETPALDLDFAFNEFFPIIGPLGADLAGSIGASAQFGFGFDTSGFQQYAADDFRDPSLILDGFYVADTENPDGTGPIVPQVELYGSIAAYAALDLGILQAGIGGGIFASIGFTLHDPSGTGLVHLQDIEADFQTGNVFDVTGELDAFLAAYVTIDLGFFSHTWNFNIASVTLATISEPAPSTPPTPQLATPEPGDVLRLNIGPYAPQRLYGNTADGNETYTIGQGNDGANSVAVTADGVTDYYDNISEITGEGAAGSDSITVDVNRAINVNLAVGGGNNSIIVQNAGNVTLVGGAGTDHLEVDTAKSADITGGAGIETLIVTGNEPATLQAGSGVDELYGGSGAGQLLYGGTGIDLLVAGGGANQMLHGGSGTSILVGGLGAGQQLWGDTSTATIYGGAGDDQTLNAGTGNDYLYAGEAANQTLIGGSGTNVIQVGWTAPSGMIAFGNLPQGAIDPTTGKPLQFGWHLEDSYSATADNNQGGYSVLNYTPGDANEGEGNNYVITAGGGNTLIIGGWGNDTIQGGGGNDVLYGGGGPGTKVMYAGVGPTQMYGSGPTNEMGDATDLEQPTLGAHTLYGGSGVDQLYGGDGLNLSPETSGTALVAPGGDDENQGANILVAGPGNTTMYSDTVGDIEATLIAGSGADALWAGGTSGDYLEAGSGVDSLYGGSGADVFQVPFIATTTAGASVVTPDTFVGGLGLTTLLIKPSNTVMVSGTPEQVAVTTDSLIELSPASGMADEYIATLSNLDNGSQVAQVEFPLPAGIERIAIVGGSGDNDISVNSSITRGIFLYGGPGHNILRAGGGNDVLVGGSGTSMLFGGAGDDSLYGGNEPLVYRDLIDNFATAPTGPQTVATTSSDPDMTWLRQQPSGHNYLIAGAGNSQLYAGNNGDLLIGNTATFNPTTGLFTPGTDGGRDVMEGGSANGNGYFDLMIGGAGGDAMLAGTRNAVLIGGGGENILEGGGGSDVLVGGSLINVMMSNDVAGDTTDIVGGTGLNFEFGGAGTDSLFDASNSSAPSLTPLEAPAWNTVDKVEALFGFASPPSTPAPVKQQTLQTLQRAADDVAAQAALLNLFTASSLPQLVQYGTLASSSGTITNLMALPPQTGMTTNGSYTVTGLGTATLDELSNGMVVTGNGVPFGTTVTGVNPQQGQLFLSNVASYSGDDSLTFTDPIALAPTWEYGTLGSGSNTITGLKQTIGATGALTAQSDAVTHVGSIAYLAVGDYVSGFGIQPDTYITQIQTDQSFLLSKPATNSAPQEQLTISDPLSVGEPVSGAGIEPGTTITSIVSMSSETSITLSIAATQATPADTETTLCFGSPSFAGPLVSGTGIPEGDSVSEILSGTSVQLAQNVVLPPSGPQTMSNVMLTFTLNAAEIEQRDDLDTTYQTLADDISNTLKGFGADAEVDFLQGGSGTNSLYAGPNAIWMIGTTGTDTFYIPPENYQYFDIVTNTAGQIVGGDVIQGAKAANDALMFLADGSNIDIGYNSLSNADVVTGETNAPVTPLSWTEGHNISTIGIQTMGGNDKVTIGAAGSNGFGTQPSAGANLGSWTAVVQVVDGGIANTPGLDGDVTIDATQYTGIGVFLGGAGNDTIKVDQLSTAESGSATTQSPANIFTLVEGGTGSNQRNTLEVYGDTGAVDVTQGLDPNTLSVNSGDDGLVLGSTWIGGEYFQNLKVYGYSNPTAAETNTVNISGLIPQSELYGGSGAQVTNDYTVTGGTNTFEGGTGAGVTNDFTADDGVNTMVGGAGADAMNDFTAYGGINTLIGSTGTNALTAVGGTNTIFGGGGLNEINVSGGVDTLFGGSGVNTFTISGWADFQAYGSTGLNNFDVSGGDGSIAGGAGTNVYNITAAGYYTLTGGLGANNINVSCQTYGDSIYLDQYGSLIDIYGEINGAGFDVSATNISSAKDSINVYGSADGDNTLNASGMIMGVNLYAQGYSNTLIGGAGPDILDGADGGGNYSDCGFDDLVAGNNSDTFYFSGYGSSYSGTGGNNLVYRAQPGDNVAIYQTGVELNGELAYGNYSNGQQYYEYTSGYWYPWSTFQIANVEVQDGAGTAHAHFAGSGEVPWTEEYNEGNYGLLASWSTSFTMQGNYNNNYTVPISVAGEDETAYPSYSSPDWYNGDSLNWTWGSWTYASAWPQWPTSISFNVNGYLGYSCCLFISDDTTLNLNVNVYGTEIYTYQDPDTNYAVWSNPPTLTQDPGIQVSNLTAVATSSSGVQVTFPQSFTNGGADPQTSGITYTIPNPNSPNDPPISITSGYQFPIGTTQVTATTAMDGNGNVSTATFDVTVLALNVSQDSTAVAVNPSSSYSSYGQPITLTATVVDSTPGDASPTGTVTFYNGDTVLGMGTLTTVGGVTFATATTSLLPVGLDAVYASYDNAYTNVIYSSSTDSQYVSQDYTETTVTTSLTSALLGQSVTLTATVAILSPGEGTPTGTVTFYDQGTPVGTGTLSTTDGVTTATISDSGLVLGDNLITAEYSGDTNDDPSTSYYGQNVYGLQDNTTTTVTSSQVSSAYTQPMTLTATVAVDTPGSGTPTGAVTFMDGTTTLGTGTLAMVNGVMTATLSTSALAVGLHAITAVYSGDTDDITSTSTMLAVNVAQDVTTTAVTASSVAPVYGQAVTLTATVAISGAGAGPPTGTVTFYDGTLPLGVGTLSTSAGVTTSTFTPASLVLGSHSITAVYSGDANDITSTSPALVFNVAEDTTTTTLAAVHTAAGYGQTASLTATVSVGSPGIGVPTGTVSFYNGSNLLGTGTLSTSGDVTTASLAIVNLALGDYSFTAQYGGDTDDLESVSTPSSFSSQDTTTQGNWINSYGNQGYEIISSGGSYLSLPAGVTVTADAATYTWANPATSSATQALEVPGGASRIAAAWYSPTKFTVDVDITNGQTYNLELYALDYDSQGRSEQIELTNVATGAVTGIQTLSNFSGGAYLYWSISGNTLITVTNKGPVNAVLSGLFLDTPPPVATVTSLASSLNASTYGQSVDFTATVSDLVGQQPTGSVEFYDGSTDLGPGTPSPESGNSATWTLETTDLAAGVHRSIKAVYTPTGSFVASAGVISETVNQATLVITATAVTKVYNGTTTATVTLSDNRVPGDMFTDTYASAAFVSRNAGTGQTVEVFGIAISGPGASNYTFNTTATTTGNITPAVLTITAVPNTKVYDGTTTAAGIPIVSGLIGSDTVSSLSEIYASSRAATGITLNVATYTINDGNGGNNYSVTLVPSTSGVITSSTFASAAFLGEDATTKGTWINTYGASGYDVISQGNSYVQLPPGVTVTTDHPSTYTWANPAKSAPQALEIPGGASRIAATWYSPTYFTVDINVTNGQWYNLELYLLDYDSQGRSEQIQLTNATTGAVLSTETVSNFSGGEYVDFRISGNTLITFTNKGPANAVLGGLFLDPNTAATPAITWSSPTSIVYGTPLSATQLDAQSSLPGTYSYTPAAGTILKAGTNQTLSVTFTPTNSASYTTAFDSVGINVLPATPTITWANPANIVYGTALSTTQLDATASVPGTFSYALATGTVLKAGNGQMLSVIFTPTDSTDYTTASDSVLINVTPATPTINWATPATMVYGTALSSAQLDAASSWKVGTTAGSIAGTFTYTPAAGTVLPVGNVQTLSVTFTPTDSTDFTTATGTVTVNVIPAAATAAKFLEQDKNTEGNWVDTYGTQGYDVLGNSASLPSYASITPNGESVYTWASTTTDPRALEDAGLSGRIASGWYSATSFTVDVDFTDGKTHDLELYFVDWDTTARSEQVKLTNAATGAVLDTETVSSFHSGIYDNWQVSGNVLITITRLSGANAVLNGLFFDPTSTSTAFLSQDSTTEGNWINTYGTQGYDVIGNAVSLPSYATVTTSGAGTYTWSGPGSTTDPRALQEASGTGRLAAAWYSATSFKIDVDFTDGELHDLELYFVDWDTTGRSEQVTVTNAATGAVLDTETVASFHSGVYENWELSGNIVITITKLTGANAVVSGLFFDPQAPTSASFLKQDTTTEGTWINNYGSQGYDVIGNAASLPSYVAITPHGQTNYTWAASTTDPRALETSGNTGRIAAGWYSTTSFTVDVDFTDGNVHDLELYFVDWDTDSRSEQVTISNASTFAVLATETVSSFHSGFYDNWLVSGNVLITITDLSGANAVLNGLFIDPKPAPSSATFLNQDTTTQGNWLKTYGSQGYDVIGNASSIPSYATVTPSGQATYTWSGPGSTTNPRALQEASGTGRLAAAWYSASSFSIDVDFTDGKAHDLGLYFLDWDDEGRSEEVQITSAATGAVLDTETVSSFQSGVYDNWVVTGNVVIKIIKLSGANAVVSGLFFNS